MGPSLQATRTPGALNSNQYFAPRQSYQKLVGGSGRRGLNPKRLGHFRVEAKSKSEEALQGALQKGNEIIDAVVEFVPESVPRSTARTVTAVVGVALIWFFIQKIFSFFFFLILIGGGIFLYTQSQGNNGGGRGGSGGSGGGGSDSDDPMEAARKIMDKYK